MRKHVADVFLGLSLGLLVYAAGAGRAATVYTNETDFVNALGASETFLNDFNDLTDEEQYVHALQYSSNGLAYYIASNPNLQIFSLIGAVTTTETNVVIVTAFTSSNVHALGGWFYLTDTYGNAADGSVTVNLNGNTAAVIASSTSGPSFWGYITGGLLLTNVTIQSDTAGGFPILDHFYVSEGEPVFATPFVTTNMLILSWPAPSTGYVLQSSTNLAAAIWPALAVMPQNVNNYWQAAVPMTNPSAFYRLVKQ